MCLIIDANVASLVLTSLPDADFKSVTAALLSGQATLCHGGKLTDEYSRLGSVVRFLRLLDQAGRVRVLPHDQVEQETKRLQEEELCRSDDPHVLAVARVGKVRLLCSRDEALTKDFKNPAFIDRPRGSVYRNAKHAHLLRRHCQH